MISADLERLLSSSTLVKQGAEAKVYKIELMKKMSGDKTKEMAILKYRFPKTYRHPELDIQLTRHRLTFEARALTRALKSGICVPLLKGLDVDEGWLIQEWIDGVTLRTWLDQHPPGNSQNNQVLVEEMLKKVGIQIAKLHSADIIHGDLTTSNMMLRRPPSTSHDNSDNDNDPNQYEIVLIDFGLSSVNSLVEDKAVDLYVLERAFISTHSNPNVTHLQHSSPLFEILLEAYAQSLPKNTWKVLQTRLANVRSRGRKRSMVG